jgi:hypothetical protein
VEQGYPFHVRGVISGLPKPVVGVSVLMGTTDLPRATVTAVGADGRFEARLPRPGTYFIDLMTVPYLSSTRRYCEVLLEESECILEVPPTELKFSVQLQGETKLKQAVSVAIRGPVSPTDFDFVGFVSPEEALGVRLVGVEYGTFSVVAYDPRGLTSVSPVVVTLSPEAPTATGALQMATRRLDVQVRDGVGALVSATTARTRSFPLEGTGGSITTEVVPAGMPILIQAPGYLPTCRVAPVDNELSVTLHRRSNSRFTVTLLPDPGRPIGVIDGLPGSDCGVEVAGFRLDQSEPAVAGERRFAIIGLPDGKYRYRASMSAPAVDFVVPGEGIDRYFVPPGCLVCR